jgi:hypothetical protein
LRIAISSSPPSSNGVESSANELKGAVFSCQSPAISSVQVSSVAASDDPTAN